MHVALLSTSFFFLGVVVGHGGSVRDTNGDEADNMDETLVPVDYTKAGQITDDVILKEVTWAFLGFFGGGVRLI